MGFEVLLSRESWPSLAGYFIIVSLTGMDKAVFLLDPILPMAVSGRFLLGLPCAVFVQDLHGSSVISRQEGPVLFPCDGTKDWLPCGRKGDIEQSTGTLIRLPSWHSDHSSAWLSTGTDQQFRVTRGVYMALCQKLLSHLAAANRTGFISVHCSCSLQWCPGLGESVWYLVRKLSVLNP